MRDIASTRRSGVLSREVELGEKTNHFTVEVYGVQARACAAHLGTGSNVVVDAEVHWREWNDEQNTRPEAVIFRRVRYWSTEPARAGATRLGTPRRRGSARTTPQAPLAPRPRA
jgi:single-stranded DNA-binding protein